LEDLIDRMHLHAAVRQTSGERSSRQGDDDDRSRVTLDIRGEDMGLLIGRRGETLTALQLMLNMLVSRRLKRRTTVTVDVEGYRRRREEDIERMAQRIAGQVKANGEPFTFEPMQSRERRLIHMALANDARVMTESTGDGDQRRVVVMLKPGPTSGPNTPSSRGSLRPSAPPPEPFDEAQDRPLDEARDKPSDEAQDRP
jgi:spoIIIJ-associated protein